MKFYELAVGARFFFWGRRYVKLAMSMAEDEDRVGHIFQAETEVTADGEPLLLPPEEAARWKLETAVEKRGGGRLCDRVGDWIATAPSRTMKDVRRYGRLE